MDGGRVVGPGFPGNNGKASKIPDGETPGDTEAVSTANGKTSEVTTEPLLEGNKLILRGTHIGGAAPGEVRMHEFFEIARQHGRQHGVKQIVIEGGRRSSGRMIGKAPRSIVIDLE